MTDITNNDNAIIINKLSTIHHRINKACERSGRNISDVQLLLATKTVAADRIAFALHAGEN